MSLTVFANFRIDSKERLQRMKDSFNSFNNAEINQWVINARGLLKNEAIQFLNDNLDDKLIASDFESNKGWFFCSRQMIEKITSEYVFFWIEDHICMCGASQLNAVLRDMKKLNVEYLGYSWFGRGLFLNQFNNINCTDGESLSVYVYTKEVNRLRQKNSLAEKGEKPYIISVCGIFTKDLFVRILNLNRPYLRRWPKQTPFDFEKKSHDVYILPIRYGVPKFEMFSSIDDDNTYPGSSLHSRGLYPRRVERLDMIQMEYNIGNKSTLFAFTTSLKRILVVRILYKFLKRISFHF